MSEFEKLCDELRLGFLKLASAVFFFLSKANKTVKKTKERLLIVSFRSVQFSAARDRISSFLEMLLINAVTFTQAYSTPRPTAHTRAYSTHGSALSFAGLKGTTATIVNVLLFSRHYTKFIK